VRSVRASRYAVSACTKGTMIDYLNYHLSVPISNGTIFFLLVFSYFLIVLLFAFSASRFCYIWTGKKFQSSI